MFVNSSEVLSIHDVEYGNPVLQFTEDPSTTKLFAPLGEDAYVFSTY